MSKKLKKIQSNDNQIQKDIPDQKLDKAEKDTYVVRRHYNNKHTFEELFALIIKSHS